MGLYHHLDEMADAIVSGDNRKAYEILRGCYPAVIGTDFDQRAAFVASRRAEPTQKIADMDIEARLARHDAALKSSTPASEYDRAYNAYRDRAPRWPA